MSHSVVFLNRFYWPDHSATAQMLTDLTEDLVTAGWDVSVITSRARYDGGPEAGPAHESHRGVTIIRVGARGGSRHSMAGRLFGYVRYLAGAATALLVSRRWDAVVAMSDPPMLVVLATLVSSIRRRRVIYWVQDVFPTIAERLGVIRAGSVVARMLNNLSWRAVRRCDLVIALGDRMREELIAHGAPAGRTVVVHNWADGAAIHPVPAAGNAFVAANGLEGRFVVLYSGNAGRAHKLDAVIDAAARLNGPQDPLFVFVGGGARIPELKSRAARSGAAVRFLDYVPREEISSSLGAASVALVAEDPAVIGTLVPSKLYGILASGRPVILLGSADSDVGRVIIRHECGWIIPPDDAAGLVELLLHLQLSPDELSERGQRARRAFEGEYDRPIATRNWMNAVDRARGERK
jgi:colanic acid biosynthesis glycosyl transferase WcaI